jgi:hypothetical protein
VGINFRVNSWDMMCMDGFTKNVSTISPSSWSSILKTNGREEEEKEGKSRLILLCILLRRI